MAGLIKREDIDEVRQRTDIKEVVDGYVTLKGAGLGSFKGLCPFHDERSPVVHRPPAGGHATTASAAAKTATSSPSCRSWTTPPSHEAVEKLAARIGYELRYEDGGTGPRPRGRRPAAAAAGRAQDRRRVLPRPAADPGRRRGPELPLRPRLRPRRGGTVRRGLRAAGLGRAAQAPAAAAASPTPSSSSPACSPKAEPGDLRPFPRPADLAHPRHRRRHHRLRRPQALRGRPGPEVPQHPGNRALQEVAGPLRDRPRQAEHRQGAPAGGGGGLHRRDGLPPGRNPTAVATCGTAFGTEHIKIARRLLSDDGSGGEVIFTFDGDAAGQKAALRAFEEDQRFVAQTYVAVEPSGADPCDLRQAKGDAAVRDLISTRRPLFEFAIRATLKTAQPGHRRGPGRGPARIRAGGGRRSATPASGRATPGAGRLAGHGGRGGQPRRGRCRQTWTGRGRRENGPRAGPTGPRAGLEPQRAASSGTGPAGQQPSGGPGGWMGRDRLFPAATERPCRDTVRPGWATLLWRRRPLRRRSALWAGMPASSRTCALTRGLTCATRSSGWNTKRWKWRSNNPGFSSEPVGTFMQARFLRPCTWPSTAPCGRQACPVPLRRMGGDHPPRGARGIAQLRLRTGGHAAAGTERRRTAAVLPGDPQPAAGSADHPPEGRQAGTTAADGSVRRSRGLPADQP